MKTHFGVVYRVLGDGWLRLWDLERERTHTVDGTALALGQEIEGQFVRFALEDEDVLQGIERISIEQLPEKLQPAAHLRSSDALREWAGNVTRRLEAAGEPVLMVDQLLRAIRPAAEAEDEETAGTGTQSGVTLQSD